MSAVTDPAPAARTPGRLRRAWTIAWPWLFWAPWGAWLGVLDLRNEDVQPSVIVLIAGAALLGSARPRRWWAWGAGLALWIPAVAWWTRARGGAPGRVDVGGVVLPLAIGLVGGAIGLAIARATRPQR